MKMKQMISAVGFKLKKNSPEILVVSGIVGVVVAAVMACKATTKVPEVLEEANDALADIHAKEKDKKQPEETTRKEVTVVYIRAGLKFVKLYGPSVALGALSIAGILTSNNILKKRNIELAAAYATIDKGFKAYRKRVIERFGEEVEKELRYDIKEKEIEETVTDENGEEKTVKKTINVTGYDGVSEYAKFFDESSPLWEKDAEMNLINLNAAQKTANRQLRLKGHLFLNEVYDLLGIPRTRAGQVVGWLYRPDDPDCIGDNKVCFGIHNANREKNRDFVNGYERSILLDFNVDGDILHRKDTLEYI